jgi:capsular exopolysaccharide synthesis family protein
MRKKTGLQKHISKIFDGVYSAEMKERLQAKMFGPKTGAGHPLDPIARNDKDTNKSEPEIQTAEVFRSNPVPVLAASTPLLPGHPWGLDQHTQAAPSTADLIKSILRFKWTLLLVFILVSAAMIAIIWTQMVPKYQARAEVRVRPIIPRLVFRTDDNGMIPLYDSFVNTQVSIIRSLTVLQRVLDQKEIQETQWYKNPSKSFVQGLRGNTYPPMERIRDDLSVQPRPRTEIIDVSFIDLNTKDAKLIVDAVLDQYIKYIREKSDATEDELYRQLVDQYKSLENDIQGREKVCAELHKALGTEIPQELVSSKRVRLDEKRARLSELQNNITILEWETKQTVSDDSNDIVAASSGVDPNQPKYYEDAEWRKLDLDMRTIQHQIANNVRGPNHPDMILAQKDTEFAEELLRLREVQLDEQWRNQPKNMAGVPITSTGTGGPDYRGGLISLEHQLTRSKNEEQLLRAELEKQEAEFKGLFQSAQLLDKENIALKNKRELFDAVRQRLEQKNIERNVPGSIEVLMHAYSPSRPYNDRRIVFTAMALFMGLGVGGGAAFLRASRNQTIYAPKDMPQPMQVPLLGHIPAIRTRKPLGISLWDEIGKNQFLLIESIRVLRTVLLSRLDGQGSSTVLITSAMAGTGKSSFTMVLGKSIAQAGKKVLMIDADLQKKTLSKWFDLFDKPGFMDSLSSRSIDKQHIFATETFGLNIMPAGTRVDNSVVFEEIANGAFKICMEQISKEHNFDIILLDSSPILPVADATILASQVDGTIMVEREHLSRRASVANALARLGSSGGRLLGTVFIGSGGFEEYGYEYGYHHDDNKTSKS